MDRGKRGPLVVFESINYTNLILVRTAATAAAVKYLVFVSSSAVIHHDDWYLVCYRV